MTSKWMIRTRSNHLLGPIGKEKILELIENGSIHTDDEICSGNGYWFYLRETDLLNKYVYSDVVQEFNPVSEALNEMCLRQAGSIPQSTVRSNDMPNGNVSIKKTERRAVTQVIPLEDIKNKDSILEDIKSPDFENEDD